MTSPTLDIVALPYRRHPLGYFEALRHRRGAVLLDSGKPESPGGRYDILSCDPLALLEIDNHGHLQCSPSRPLPDDPFKAQQAMLDSLGEIDVDSDLPFLGGLIGYWSYDLSRHLEPLPNHAKDATHLPRCRVGLYDWALIQDHQQQRSWLVASSERRRQVMAWLDEPSSSTTPFRITAPFVAEMDAQDYGERFRAVQRYIHSGDCYQINLAQRFSAPYEGDLWQAYRRLRAATPTPFSGFMAWADQGILSLSPERFLQARGGSVEARPIKGTRPRGQTPGDDKRLADELVHSDKDRAENVMIVDLLRNDLGRVCRPGSVQVPQLCGLESYANVHHLVSVIQGELDTSYLPLDLLAAAFPGGSITGAPKVRAMQIIDELEPSRRSVYCGSLGYIDRRGHMDTSIAIRTAVAEGGHLHLWGGGGLVADSDETAEYHETLDKISHLLTALDATCNVSH
ncbi:aminodeoxychorismate synthase component I [Aidingimonas halophila]|uniref:aminodeoxychorismate synthase n=1 Tax=Aidingimonas halophila TaxID=574349 RepID=A0A1H3A6U8_9GAMM|nr:aminodeoxychorismate synthase component I [Aidingimonas halophila]GHC21704.1 aminodeoxychorismate synthase, component I [Aidingimonas halophila]SDX25470.1 aminodeoxychorismate synthase, subunit I [Aidingimonas halophila]